jgi:tripartite-type tricarboxylate transporter receptor subunit TctC
VPTAKESGLPTFVATSWNALAAPAKTPKGVIARLNKDVVAALNAPDVKKRLHDQNVEAQSSSPEQASELLASEIKRWGDVIVRAKIPQQ